MKNTKLIGLAILHILILGASNASACEEMLNPFEQLDKKGVVVQELSPERDIQHFKSFGIEQGLGHFDIYDLDKNGSITRDETNKAINEYYAKCNGVKNAD